MAGVVQSHLQVQVQNDKQLEDFLCSKGLKVVEVYSEWCGPCKSVVPTLKRIRVDKDDETALTFLLVPADKCEFLEQTKDFKGKSEPLFLLYRNGQLKGKIEGANTPSLSTQILTWTPANADMDDLEENPLYLARAERERIARGEFSKDSKTAKKGKK